MAIVLLIEPAHPTADVLAFIGFAVLALLISTRLPIPSLVLLGLLVGGIVIRFAIRSRVGSDVLDVTVAAIERMLTGLNPYGVGYQESNPPGAPFPYGPVALAWYLPVLKVPRTAELLSATFILTVLALQGRFLGLAVYATLAAVVSTSVDGSNDTTLGLLLFGTFALAEARPTLAAIVLAAAVAFKVSAAAWVPAFLLWGGWRVAAFFGASSLAFWSPVLLWGPGSFVDSLVRANQLHREIVWSLGAALRDILGTDRVRVLDNLRLVFGALVAVVSLRFARSLDGVIVAGTLVYLVTLLGGTWGTHAYLAAIAPLLCLRVDDWLGLPTLPLRRREASDDAESDPETAATAPVGESAGF